MTRSSLALLGATATLALFGGLHLEIASGRGLDRATPGDARLLTGTTVAGAINREGKADRGGIALNTVEGRTVIFQHPDLQETTVALRVWESVTSAKNRPATKDRKEPANKPRQAVACEPVVSALTEVAKQLDAGRCVT